MIYTREMPAPEGIEERKWTRFWDRVDGLREGAQARDEGKSKKHCPYERGCQLFKSWHLGWKRRNRSIVDEKKRQQEGRYIGSGIHFIPAARHPAQASRRQSAEAAPVRTEFEREMLKRHRTSR